MANVDKFEEKAEELLLNEYNAPIVKQLGHEDLFDFAKRVVKELSEDKFGESVVIMDCGEGIMVIVNKKTTVDTIINEFEKKFDEGCQDRYEQFEADIRRKRASNG